MLENHKINMLINLPFFLLPFFLFYCVVSGAIGFYVFLFLYPLIFVVVYQIKIPKYILNIAIILGLMHLSFVAANFLNYFFQNPTISSVFYEKNYNFYKLLKSRLPFQYLTISLFFFALYFMNYVKLREKPLENKDFLDQLKPLESFFKGFFYAGIIFLILFTLETITKINYRYSFEVGRLAEHPQSYPYRFARPSGALANGLTLASMSLAVFTFLYTYFFRMFFLHSSDDTNNPFFNNNKHLIVFTLLPSMFFAIILFLTQSRMAIAVAFVVLVFVPIFSSSKKERIKALIIGILFAIFAYIICFNLGYIDRMREAFQEIHAAGLEDRRAIFREIYLKMFCDHPWFGNGSYWISKGLRDHYYVALGYSNFFEKNYPAHNIYLELLASGGIMCASIAAYGLWKCQKIIRTFLMNKQNHNYTLWVAFVIAFVANLIHGLTQNNFVESSTTYTYSYLFFVIFWQTILSSRQIR